MRHLAAAALGVAFALGSAAAQQLPDALPSDVVSNWTAPPFWTPSASVTVEKLSESGILEPMALETVPTGPLPFFGITPCRMVDTRPSQGFTGAYGPPILAANATRDFDLNSAAHCPGVPAGAEAYSLNITVTETTGPGDIRIWPTGTAPLNVSTQNWAAAGVSLANAAVVPAGTNGSVTVQVAGSSTHLIIDINGYYAPIEMVTTVNSLSGPVTLAPGTDVTIDPIGNTLTIGTDATSSNTADTIVRRDGSGDFGARTVALSGNLTLPATSSTAGNIVQGGNRLLHTFGTSSVFLGSSAGNYTMTGSTNSGVGVLALTNNTTGNFNAALGAFALQSNMSGSANTALGVGSLDVNISGSSNTAVGVDSLGHNTGSSNIAIGKDAGDGLTTGSNNICIGNFGVAAEAGTIRIGTGGLQTRAFLAGVRGVTTGAADGLTVLIDSNGQLGTISSSASVKREIADIGEASSRLRELRPVSFLYRGDASDIPQYGLIAEEVAEVMPELVQFSSTGSAETVRYHFLAPLLLNELQKEQRQNEDQESRIAKLLARLEVLEARVSECEGPAK